MSIYLVVGPDCLGQPSRRQLLRRRQVQAHGGASGRRPGRAPAAGAGWHQQWLPQAGGGQSLGSEVRGGGRCRKGRGWRGALHQLPQRRHIQVAPCPAALLVILCTQQRVQLWVLVEIGDGRAAAAQLAVVGPAGGGGAAAARLLGRWSCCALL